MTSFSGRKVQIRDLATAEEIAAVVAALDAALHASRPSSVAGPSGYERWRQTRLETVRAR